MSDKQSLLQAVGALPDGATWAEITDTLLALLARRGANADFARLYRSQLTDEQLAEYLGPKGEYRLDDVLAELDAGKPA
jgi:hypothetical protein